MGEPKVTVARHTPTGEARHIKRAANGLGCNCKCLKCNQLVEAIQGGERTWHYRHSVNRGCLITQESALHILAKEIIANAIEIRLSEEEVFQSERASIEETRGNFKIDVILFNKEQELLVEVAVTHFIEYRKEQYFLNEGHRALEINISNVDRNIGYEDLEELLLSEFSNKRLIEVQPKPEKTEKPEKQLESSKQGTNIYQKFAIGLGIYFTAKYIIGKIKDFLK